ncbi:MAG: response regulator [Pseudomonadota bacterium]
MPVLQRILYAEDDNDIRAVAQIALEAIGGFTLRTCGSGKEAVAAAPEFMPELVLLDVMMPGMDGPATLAALRGIPEFAAAPVVFMTAKVQPGEVAAYKALGAIDVILKPFDPMTLATTIRQMWEKSHG